MTTTGIDVTNTDPEYWEEILETETLGVKQLGLEDEPGEQTEMMTEPEIARKTSGNNRDFEQLRTKLDKDDTFLAGGHQIKKIRTREKDTPPWATNNAEIRKLLLRAFPKLKTDPKQRKRAARWAAVIHLFYRVGMTKSQIATELKTKTPIINLVLQRARWTAKGYRADHSGIRSRKG